MLETGPTTSGSAQIGIRLPSDFTHLHQQIVHRYFSGQEPLSSDDWAALIQAMDVLRRALMIWDDKTETFAAFYDRVVDAVYSDSIIEQLLTLPAPERDGEALRATVARSILTDLRGRGLWRADVPESQFLVAFCLYWWQAFVRGYAFEIAIYRDLTDSGVVYRSHDLRDRNARLSGYDLEVMDFHGDVKTSTYFVLTRRSEALVQDFYVTRMYHAVSRQWQRVVWLKPRFWQVLNGRSTPVAYEAIWRVLPGVAEIVVRGRKFIVVLYDEWKRRIVAKQQREARDV